MFDAHLAACALDLALASAGSSMAARMAMMAITTNSSMSVKAALGPDRAQPAIWIARKPERPTSRGALWSFQEIRASLAPLLRFVESEPGPLLHLRHLAG